MENKEHHKDSLGAYSFEKIELADIIVHSPEKTLFVIGNGFDIMHGVKSRYSDFRDSLGERDSLRTNLEIWIQGDNLWSDFEANLAHIDADGMLSTVDSWMDDFDVKGMDDPDFSAADFFMAQDAAASPAIEIMDELPKQFRKWVNGLATNCAVKPLSNILHTDSFFFNFNYTEFLESLYAIPSNKILYIHGDRRNRRKELVLGHEPDAEYEIQNELKEPHFRGQSHYDAYQGTLLRLNHYYDSTTKKSSEIIKDNGDYFDKLQGIGDVIVIGHSLSIVDYPYFREIIRKSNSPECIKWKISWHSSSDIERIESFATAMGIDTSQIVMFNL